MDERKPLITARELSKLMGFGINRAYELMNREDFPVVQFGRRKYVSVKGLEKWLDKEVDKRMEK